MRCLILGGGGMLGHQLLIHLQAQHATRVVLRGRPSDYGQYGLFHADNAFYGVDVRDMSRLRAVFDESRPQAVVNAVGIIKQKPAAYDLAQSIEVNALLPHRLRLLCEEFDARFIHISTDCVFNGRRGGYRETDPGDADDHYGRTKYLGEVHESPAVTLRCSMIGLELNHGRSLVEWFLAQRGEVRGFTRAIFSGLTTMELARVVERILSQHADLSGLWQVAAEPIDKYTLLTKLAERLDRRSMDGRDVAIVPDDSLKIDRSLSPAAFAARTGYQAPSWSRMLDELAQQINARSMQHDAA